MRHLTGQRHHIQLRSLTARAALAGVALVIVAASGEGATKIEATTARGLPPSSSRTQSDFNGDGRSDLAIGMPLRDVGQASNAGAILVLYASNRGVSLARGQIWTQDSSGIPDSAESEEAWGSGTAPGDFNGDGFADLAVVSTHDLGVTVMFGSPAGLQGPGAQFLYESVDQDRGLVAGNFDGDGFADLAWISLSGSLYVRHGSASGLKTSGQVWTPDSPDLCDEGEWGDSLASADFDGDGFDDLAVGDPSQTVQGNQVAGQIQVMYGSTDGLGAARNQCWNQATPGILDDPRLGDFLGWDVAGADFNGDGFGDLAAGASGERKVNVIYGSSVGLTESGNQLLEGYSAPLCAGDFDADGSDDLVMGEPDYTDMATAQGRVLVVYGSPTGLVKDTVQQWDQGTRFIPNDPESGDFFGGAVTAGNYGNGLGEDLAIGVPFEDSGSELHQLDTGALHVIYGSSDGLVTLGNQFLALPRRLVTTNDEAGYSLNGQQDLSH
jgi:VCBS repeat protein/FG-GAP repeat protein